MNGLPARTTEVLNNRRQGRIDTYIIMSTRTRTRRVCLNGSCLHITESNISSHSIQEVEKAMLVHENIWEHCCWYRQELLSARRVKAILTTSPTI